ncbi:MAG: sugar nucleotide-binding protein, partial [Spirochaetales bacterium]|nr:sugar nucleotide-binding protein [Spirochaetales bacterium]
MIWLIGSKGMLGQEIAGLLKENSMDYCGTDRETDITDLEVLRAFIKDKDFGWIINCSAYTAVEKAEEEQKSAYLINETGVMNIGQVAAEKDIPVIHLSTDYVFNGKKDLPLTEEEPTDPVSVYGASKLAGEKA